MRQAVWEKSVFLCGIVSSESGTVANNLKVGQVGAQQTVRLDFNGTTLTNASGGSAPIPLLAAPPYEKYSLRLTIGADKDMVTVNCIQTDPEGAKRNVLSLTDSTTNLLGVPAGPKWKQ